MKRIVLSLLSVAAISSMGACPVSSDTTSVRLVNNASFPVTVQLFYGDNQDVLEAVLETLGHEANYTIDPGSTESLSLNCQELQAVFIKKAKLSLVGGVGPTASTSVYRDGHDFNCGDTPTFTFTQAALATKLNIDFSK